ncbi:hypothetical protein TKK_0019498 [Trichogramma kaykai]
MSTCTSRPKISKFFKLREVSRKKAQLSKSQVLQPCTLEKVVKKLQNLSSFSLYIQTTANESSSSEQ